MEIYDQKNNVLCTYSVNDELDVCTSKQEVVELDIYNTSGELLESIRNKTNISEQPLNKLPNGAYKVKVNRQHELTFLKH